VDFREDKAIMSKTTKITNLACVGLLAISTAAMAKDPLLGGSSKPATVADTDLANVKGSGAFAQYYGYYGTLASYYSYLYGLAGYNDNAAGLFGLAYNNFLTARDQANAAASNYNFAAYYAFFGL
jgi:hypothetical protein